MWFLIKCAFWLTLVLLVLPVPDEQRPTHVAQVSTGEAVSALTAALNDVRGFCQRNPDACATGATAMQGLGYKAQAGARMLHDFISEQLGEPTQRPAATGATESRPAASNGGTDTLTPQDLQPAWRGPESTRERRA